MRRRKLYKRCINEFLLENKKVFQTFFLLWREVVLSCSFFILSMAKTIDISQQEFVIIILVEFFTAHLLKKIQDFIIYLARDIDEIIKNVAHTEDD